MADKKEQLSLIDTPLFYSPKMQERHIGLGWGEGSKASEPKLKAKAEQFEILPDYWYALQKKTEARSTLLIVEARFIGNYLIKGKTCKWKLAYNEYFKTKEEAQGYIESLGLLWSLEDPNKTPRRQGSAAEVARLEYLNQCLEMKRPPFGDNQKVMIASIFNQWDRYDKVLTPKQWEFIWRFYEQVVDRLERRKAALAARGNEWKR